MDVGSNLYSIIALLAWLVVIMFATLPIHRYLKNLKIKNIHLGRVLQVLYLGALVVSGIGILLWNLQ